MIAPSGKGNGAIRRSSCEKREQPRVPQRDVGDVTRLDVQRKSIETLSPRRAERDRRIGPPRVENRIREARQIPRNNLHPGGMRGLDAIATAFLNPRTSAGSES